MKNLSLYCGLVDAKIRASEKDLPVQMQRLVWFSLPQDAQGTGLF